MEASFLLCLAKLLILMGGISVVYLLTAGPAAAFFGRTRRWGRQNLAEVTECTDEEMRQRYGEGADRAVILLVHQ